jgi:hypothetical protein
LVIFDNDVCVDNDNLFSMAEVIALDQLHYVNLIGVVSEDSTPDPALWRQMLDQAGLNNVPVSVPPTTFSGGQCNTANLTAYNASTPQNSASYESSTVMYRTLFVKYATKPILVQETGPFAGLGEFMSSAADGISSLTGLQLFAQNAANGGAVYAQGLSCTPSAYPQTTPCASSISGDNSMGSGFAQGQEVVNNNGAAPIYWQGGIPASAGPGILSTRTSLDPFWLQANTLASDVRQCFDCLATSAIVSPLFWGGVEYGVREFNGIYIHWRRRKLQCNWLHD